jgi:hypothetical protein
MSVARKGPSALTRDVELWQRDVPETWQVGQVDVPTGKEVRLVGTRKQATCQRIFKVIECAHMVLICFARLRGQQFAQTKVLFTWPNNPK